MDEIEQNDIRTLSSMEKILETVEEGNFFEKVQAIFQLSGKLLFLKNTLKEAIEELFQVLIMKLETFQAQQHNKSTSMGKGSLGVLGSFKIGNAFLSTVAVKAGMAAGATLGSITKILSK